MPRSAAASRPGTPCTTGAAAADAATIAASGTPPALRRRSAWASTFVASLELARHGDVAVAQQAFLAPVHLSAAAHANRPPMSKTQTAPPTGFTPGERDYIRCELDMFFSTLPRVAEGFHLKTWRGGPHAGQPKLSPNAKRSVERGRIRLDTSQRLPRLFYLQGSNDNASSSEGRWEEHDLHRHRNDGDFRACSSSRSFPVGVLVGVPLMRRPREQTDPSLQPITAGVRTVVMGVGGKR